ncbi:peptidyl-Lys metalloendopeptidase [Oxalobacteraceae bacterium GrIS 1.11]
MNVRHILKFGVMVMAVATCFGAQAASNGVTATITPEKNTLSSSDDVVLNVTISNTSTTPQSVLKYHTPLGGVQASLFDITRDGSPVQYIGRQYKRPAPTASDYIVLKPGASHTVRVELSALYDMRVTGDYSIRYHTSSLNLFNSAPDSGARTATATPADMGEIDSAPVKLWIDGSVARGGVAPAPLSLESMRAQTAGLSTSHCSSSQSSKITAAISAAKAMASDGNNYLNAGKKGSRYTTWFGSNNSSRYATVKAHFAAIKNALETKPVVVDCACTDSAYAYVYPNEPYTIYVCNAFWPAPTSGTDSKGGTLVHEMSHFDVVASTNDWVYGQSAAASLATSNPAKAIDNADTHEYFGENNPSLP